MSLADSSLMPSGKYKDEKMIDVPADYLIWVYENDRCGKEVKKYIENNLGALREQATKLQPPQAKFRYSKL